MRRKVISSATLISIVVSTILSLSAIYSDIGTAKADSVVATIPVGQEPVGIAFDSTNGNLYVGDGGANTVSVISGKTNTVTSTIPSSEPLGIAFDSANGNLYVINVPNNSVSVISGQTNTVIGSPIPVGSGPFAIAFDSANGNLYVTNARFGQNTVSVISGQTNTVIASIPVGLSPEGIAFDSTNDNLYVANLDNTVSVISGQTNTVIASIPVVSDSKGIAFDSANGNLYVTNLGANTVSVISGQTNTVIGSPIPVGHQPQPFGIAFDSANGNLYVVNSGDGTVSVISAQTNRVIGNPIPVGKSPIAIAFDSANDNLYVTNAGDNTVSVISTMLTPAQAIQQLIQIINGMHLNSGIQAGLDAQLNAILTTLSSPSNNNLPFACPRLNALTNAVIPGYLRAGQLNSNQAGQIIQLTQAIMTALHCNPTPLPQQAPIANAGPSQTVNQGSAVTLNGAASFAQNGATIMSYQWIQTSGPPISLNRANTASPTFTAPAVSTTLTFSLTVTDSTGAVSSPSTITITVGGNSNNQPPVAIATTPSQVVSRGSLVTLDGTRSFDPTGNTIVSYSWVQTSGITVALSGASTATPTFIAPSISFGTTLTFSLTVTNSAGVQSIVTPQSTVSVIVR